MSILSFIIGFCAGISCIMFVIWLSNHIGLSHEHEEGDKISRE